MKLKRNTIVLVLLPIIFMVSMCFLYENFISKNTQNDVIIEIVKESVTPEYATIIVKSDDPVHRIGWELVYRLQTKKHNKWIYMELPESKDIWTAVGTVPLIDGKKEMLINYGSRYGKLEKGTYRIVTYWRDPDFNAIEYFSDEFKIK